MNDSAGRSISDVFDRCFDMLDAYLSRVSVEYESEKLDKIRKRVKQRAGFQYKHDQDSIHYYDGKKNLIEALVRTLMADLDQDYQRLGPKNYRQFWERDPRTNAAMGFEIWALSFATNRCLVITENGYIGLGPRQVKTKDQVCIMYGCSVPLIVRPCDNGFSMIGEAYVHGLMDGEAVKYMEDKNLKEMHWTIF
jgi:hypothetical protein